MTISETESDRHPHGGGRVVVSGPPFDQAAGVIIALHGRGAGAEDIVGLAQEVAPANVAIVAPEAEGNTWYPYRFLEPSERNEPYLSSALRRVRELVGDVQARGVVAERIALLGFSQGACLAVESAARLPQRYAGVLVFSGGLIGPPGTAFDYEGSLDGTPVFLGSSDVDPHIPKERVQESAAAMRKLGGEVDARLYPGMGHTVNREEVEAAQSILKLAYGAE